jgi:hypothetical protein
VVIAGLCCGGDLVVVGRTVPLSPAQSAALGANHPITPAATSLQFGADPLEPVDKRPLEQATSPEVQDGQAPDAGSEHSN